MSWDKSGLASIAREAKWGVHACVVVSVCMCVLVGVCVSVRRLIKEREGRSDASLPLLCDEKLRESWANRSGFSSFSSLTLIQKQFSAISWGTICNDTRIPLSAQSQSAIPPTCQSKSSPALRQSGLCGSKDTQTQVVSSTHIWGMNDKLKKRKR